MSFGGFIGDPLKPAPHQHDITLMNNPNRHWIPGGWIKTRLCQDAQKMLLERILDGTIDQEEATDLAWQAAALDTARKRPPFFPGQISDDALDAMRYALNSPDPNQDMIEDDNEEWKRKEFDAIIRRREYEKRKKGLSKPIAEEFWDGEHLSNAIEKTVSAAAHPQAMWGIHGT